MARAIPQRLPAGPCGARAVLGAATVAALIALSYVFLPATGPDERQLRAAGLRRGSTTDPSPLCGAVSAESGFRVRRLEHLAMIAIDEPMFRDGSLKPEARQRLERLARELQPLEERIAIEISCCPDGGGDGESRRRAEVVADLLALRAGLSGQHLFIRPASRDDTWPCMIAVARAPEAGTALAAR